MSTRTIVLMGLCLSTATVVDSFLTSTSSLVKPNSLLQQPKLPTLALRAIRAEGEAEFAVPPRKRLESPVQTFSSVMECLDKMDGNDSVVQHSDSELPKLSIVLFFAHYCKLCHKANIPYKKLAYKNPHVNFTRLETSVMTSAQLRSLGVSRVPFVQIYQSGICVASFSTKWQLQSKLTEALEHCQGRSKQEWDAFVQHHKEEIQENLLARQALRTQVSLASLQASNKAPEGIQSLSTETQLVEVIDHRSTLEQDALTVVMFHSHFEQACVRAQHQYRRLVDREERNQAAASESSSSRKNTKRKSKIRWTRIESSVVSDTTLEDLGVQRYPHIQIYRGRICVASFSIPQTYYFDKMVSDSMEAIQKKSSDEWTQFFLEFSNEIEQNQKVLEELRSSNLQP